MNWIDYGFFGFACFCLFTCLVSFLSLRRPPPILILPIFAFSLMTTELAWFFLATQIVVSLVFVALGALGHSLGLLSLGLMILSWLGLWRLHQLAHKADEVLGEALRHSMGENFRNEIPADRQPALRNHVVTGEWLRPFSLRRPGVERLSDIAYGEAGKRNLLDLYRPLESRGEGFPVLLQVHGGAWFTGHKQQQALPLMNHLAQRGWICVSINYRLSPDHRFPAHIVDVKKAIAWIRQHIAEYGGNPDFIAITGGSAGGHLVSLAALSPNDTAYQPGFEEVDTRLDAVIPIYGVYDFTDRHGKDLNRPIRDMLEKSIMPGPLSEHPELWDQASPMARVHPEAPPFFVVHGGSDVMTAPEGAEDFVSELRAVSDKPVAFAELPATQHGFDGMNSLRTNYLLNHVTDFLEWAYAHR